MILYYEYMSNGTLADHIYKSNEKSVFLSWEQRLNVCIGVGRSLEYLHTGTGINQIVIHRDLKCSNILLDADWEARLSDVGLCKIRSGNLPGIPINASVKGTRRYMDPHFCKTHELSTKSDVYALGVVLLEVLCGRRSLDFEVAHRQERLVLWAEQCFRERIVDPGLRGSLAYDVLRIFLDITLKCLQDHPKKRPPLADVVAKLEIALESTYSSSSSVDSGIFKHFNQVAYSSASANSDADPSRHTVETGSTKSDTIKQEYCIRHVDGTAVKSDGERQRIIQCIKAAIERRVSEGLMLELRTLDRVSLLSDATRIFRENSLTITRADVETKGDTVVGTFYVCDASGIRLIPRLLIQLGGKSGREISM